MPSRNDPPERLSALVLSLQQSVSQYGASVLLDGVDIGFVERAEARVEADPASPYARWLRDARKHALKAARQIQDYAALTNLANGLAEARIFEELGRCVPTLERVPEGDTSRPDFVWPGTGGPVYIEAKTLDLRCGPAHHDAVMKRGFGAKLDIEAQLARGKRVASSVWGVAPLAIPYEHPSGSDDSRSRRQAIERIIEKVEPYCSGDQLRLGPTVLLVNLERLVVLPNHSASAMAKEYVDPDTGERVSGILWHVAFGRLRRRVFREPEFEGASNHDGLLGRRGLLRSYRDVAALLFRVDGGYVGAIRRGRTQPEVAQLVRMVASDVADD